MKLIVAGATGFVGTEVIRLALRNKNITSVVALSRRAIDVPVNAGPEENLSKLQTVILEKWGEPYPDSVRDQIKDADGCIWTLAVTPRKSKEMDPTEVEKICFDYTVNGLRTIAALANKPFRFVYTSGLLVERDQSKSLWFLAKYRRMRGRTENAILEFAKQHEPDVQVTIAKPGMIEGPGHPKSNLAAALLYFIDDVPWIHVSQIAAAMIDQCVNGITKEPLWSKDLLDIGSPFLREES